MVLLNWIANALAELAKDDEAVGTSQLEWAEIESTVMQYWRARRLLDVISVQRI